MSKILTNTEIEIIKSKKRSELSLAETVFIQGLEIKDITELFSKLNERLVEAEFQINRLHEFHCEPEEENLGN